MALEVTDDGYRRVGSRVQRITALADLPDLSGQVVLVTGGTDGVGRSLVDQLATTGATVLFTARNAAKGDAVRDVVRRDARNDDVHVVDLDLADLASVRRAASSVLDGWDRLDLVILNAAHQAGRTRTVTADGFETTIGVNHLAHALLVDLLRDRIVDSAPSTVLVVASEAHRRSGGGLDLDDLMMQTGRFRPKVAYGRSKLANILFTRELARRLHGTGVDVNAAHPGGVDTPMMRANFRHWAMKPLFGLVRPILVSPADAAAGLLRVALDPTLRGTSGRYFELGREKDPNEQGRDDAVAARLWTITEELAGLRPR